MFIFKIFIILSLLFIISYFCIFNEIYIYSFILEKLNLKLLLSTWFLLESINWIIYLVMYMKIINPNSLYYNKDDINKVIKKIDKLNKYEIEHIIKGSIIYDKYNHKKIDPSNFDIKDLSKKEVFYLIGYALFGIEKKKIFASNKLDKIFNLLKKIEKILNFEFKSKDTNRFLFKAWGREFITFHFRPLIFQLPIRVIINLFHYYMIYKLKFKYRICQKSKIGYLYKERNFNKKDLIFIHGFGLGYVPYIRRLKKLNEEFNLIIMILPNISSYTYYDDINCGFFPSHTLIKDSFYDFMNELSIKSINILSHSFGTYITQILRKDKRKDIIDKIILVDPIIFWIGCFKMSLYIDKIAQKGNSFLYWLIEILTNYLIFKCLYLRYICYRVMFGPDFLIYNSSEIENKNILLVLEYEDKVIPADILYNKIKDYNISYYYIKNAEHGSVLLSSQFDNVFNKIIEYY
jgi:hypothetical protein